ncbi:MAG: adenylate/guanylate cyclase domain-containing protein [Acidimicrobiales bacterium]
MRIDPVRYTRAGDVDVAYQVYGDGDVQVVVVPGAASCVEMLWESPLPETRRYLERWGAVATVAHFDKRGTGHSDRIIGAPSVEDRMEDIHAVMDAAGFDHAAVYGISEGGPLAVLFAATYPERTDALVLQGSFARITAAPDFPQGTQSAVVDEFFDRWSGPWGSPETNTVVMASPSHRGDEEYLRYLNRYERASASPATFRAILELVKEIDIRHVLPAVRCPTLVLHAAGDRIVPVQMGEYLAAHIPGARLLVYDSDDHFPTDAVDEQLDAVEEFLTGHLGTAPTDRVLATVLFTDIVGSTERAASVGDAVWRGLLERHDSVVNREIERHRGRMVKGTGDGHLATFDSPARAIRCARACIEALRPVGIDLRTGLHTGEVELRGDDVAGIAVHLAARVAALAAPGEVLVSSAVPPLVVGSHIEFCDRGVHKLKGVPGEWQLQAVTSA